MKFYQSNTFIGFTLIGVMSIIAYVQYRNKSIKLDKCSTYTIAYISRLHTNRSSLYVTYEYTLHGKRIEDTQGISNFDTDEPWFVDQRKLAKRRLLVKVYCDDTKINRVMWKIYVPDSLRHVPINGWKNVPFMYKS